MNSHLVFVYGALRRGGVNHHVLADSEFLGEHWTEPRYTMFRLGQFPVVVARGETPIVGEIYRVNQAAFDLIEELQCYPQVFSRQIVRTPVGETWMYLYNRLVGTDARVPHGDWMRYLAREHRAHASLRKSGVHSKMP